MPNKTTKNNKKQQVKVSDESTPILPRLTPDEMRTSARGDRYENLLRKLIRPVLVAVVCAACLILLIVLVGSTSSGSTSTKSAASLAKSDSNNSNSSSHCGNLLEGVHKVTCLAFGDEKDKYGGGISPTMYHVGWHEENVGGEGVWKYILVQKSDPSSPIDDTYLERGSFTDDGFDDDDYDHAINTSSSNCEADIEYEFLTITDDEETAKEEKWWSMEREEDWESAGSTNYVWNSPTDDEDGSTVLFSTTNLSCHYEQLYGDDCQTASQVMQSVLAENNVRVEDNPFDDDKNLKNLCPDSPPSTSSRRGLLRN